MVVTKKKYSDVTIEELEQKYTYEVIAECDGDSKTITFYPN